MNKQEAIDKIENAIPVFILNDYQTGKKSGLTYALELVEELDEPEKPVVPQFVADWYEENKDDFENNLFIYCINWKSRDKSNFADWFRFNDNKPIQTLVNMHQFGYEVEKEKQKMAMNLKSFFDLNKVVFTNSELELPYENSCFKIGGRRKMDLPKFRAWFKQGSKMVNVATIDFLEKEVKSHANVMYRFDEIELMQSTGFFDKNGEEIFEGDLVKVIDTSIFGGTFVGEIVFLPTFGLYGFNMLDTKVLKIKDFSKYSRGFLMRMFGNCFTLAESNLQKEQYTVEIIGNVWENKELLEEEKCSILLK